MYRELAPWFHLLTPPAEYADEAASALALLRSRVDGPLETLLELGSGGGNMASHLKREARLTLTDLSAEMLELSRTINPECEHIVGDMRTLRLGRTFDAVLAHDAICYMTTEADLGAAMTTAFEHLRPGGAALFEPDYVRETFVAGTDHGGEDGQGIAAGGRDRALRYLEWVTDPDPTDTIYEVDYAILRRHADGSVEISHDHHVEGLFPTQRWLDLLTDVGFVDMTSEVDAEDRVVFAGRRPRLIEMAGKPRTWRCAQAPYAANAVDGMHHPPQYVAPRQRLET
jgi:trans-aconitate methyltransferase